MLKDSEKNIPEYILNEMLAYLYSKGLLLKNKDLSGAVHVPIIVYPSPIVKSFFDKITFYQIAFNKIIDKLSRDQAFIEEILTPIGENDPFVKRNLEISKKAAAFEQRQRLQLGIFRNDFMVDKEKKFLFQVEYNTIASTMGFFSDGLKQFYTHFSTKYPEVYSKYLKKEVPVHKENTIESFGNSMVDAMIKHSGDKGYQITLVLFVVQVNEKNEYDQRAIEHYLWDKYQVKSRRLTLNEIAKQCTVDEEFNLKLEDKVISLCYFRAAYTPKDYIDDESWKGRELIELSKAIKCPNINTFLTTFKVFQYQLTKPDILKKYVNDEFIVNDLLRFFVKIHYLKEIDPAQQKELFKEILADLNKYIVKPQKEGGGNNFYGADIKKVITSEDCQVKDDMKSCIVMERINSVETQTIMLFENKPKIIDSVSEYSAYGVILSDDTVIHQNKSVGFLVRTKDKNSNEGGVIVGASAIDIPCLIDMPIDKDSTEPLKYSFE